MIKIPVTNKKDAKWIEEEANRLGWTIKQLKNHLAKEERIKEALKCWD